MTDGSHDFNEQMRWEAEQKLKADQLRLDRDKWDAVQKLDRDKFDADQRLKEQELRFKDRELSVRELESRRARWTNPLVLAVLGAALAALGNIAVSFYSGYQQRQIEKLKNDETQLLEQGKAEAALVLEVVKTADPDKAATNLKFLADVKLLTKSETREAVLAYVKSRPAGSGISLPAPTTASPDILSRTFRCVVQSADSGKLASAMDNYFLPAVLSSTELRPFNNSEKRPWSTSEDGKPVSKRVDFPGGPHGYALQIDLQSTKADETAVLIDSTIRDLPSLRIAALFLRAVNSIAGAKQNCITNPAILSAPQ